MVETQTNWLDAEIKWLNYMQRHHWRHQEYYKKNRDRLLKAVKDYRKTYPEKCKESLKKYYNKNKSNWSVYTMKRYYLEPNFKIKINIRNRLRKSLRGQKIHKNKYNIDYDAIINYLKPFPKDIQNYHIDHVIPLCSFDLTKEQQLRKAFAPENHRWLLAKENIVKGSKDKLQSIKFNGGIQNGNKL